MLFQGWKLDAEGKYVRQWLPELARMPTEWIHHPWDAPTSVLRAAGVDLGLNYPKPIVEMNTARECLDDAVAMMRELNRATKMEKKDDTNEVVADNLAGIKDLDIPVVVVKEVPCTSSSNDQRVPSIQNLKSSFVPHCVKDLDHLKHRQGSINNNIVKSEKSKTDEDSRSMAQSSAARKRSISKSQCAVPTSNFSRSKVKLPDGYEPPDSHIPIEYASTHLLREICDPNDVGTEKENRRG